MPLHRFFFSLLLIFLPTQLGYHFWPEWAHVLGRRVDYLAPTVYLTDILIGLTLLSWMMESWKKFSIFNFQFSIKRRNVQFIIFISAFAIINIFFAANRQVAIYKWFKVLEFAALGFYIIKTKPQFSFIIHHLSFGILYSSLIAISQFFLQHSIGGPIWWLGERTFSLDTPGIARAEFCNLSRVSCRLFLRPYATFPHPNVLGGFLAATLPLLMASMRQRINASAQWVFRLSLVFGIIALTLTFSRSAILAGVFGIGIAYFVLRGKKEFSVFSIIRYTIPLILLAVLIFQTIHIGDESVVVREQLNAAAIKVWQQSPFVGIGLGNFLVELPKALPSRAIYFLQPVHNIYLLVLAETGVVGLVVFLWVIWKAFMRFEIRKIRKPFSIYHLAFSILLLLGLVDHYPLTLQQGQLLFALLLSFSMIQ